MTQNKLFRYCRHFSPKRRAAGDKSSWMIQFKLIFLFSDRRKLVKIVGEICVVLTDCCFRGRDFGFRTVVFIGAVVAIDCAIAHLVARNAPRDIAVELAGAAFWIGN
jgi:hypothetical protein